MKRTLVVIAVFLWRALLIAQQPNPPRVTPRSGSVQLTPASRIYWTPGTVDATHPAATSFDVTVDGLGAINIGPCVQTPSSVDPTFPCDAAIPAAALQPGAHTIALRAVASTGVSAWTPVPPLDVTGIANNPVPGAPMPASVGPVILDAPPPLSLSMPPSMTVAATSPQGTPVTYPAPTPAGGKSPYAVQCTPGSGSTFVVGITTVTCTVVDALSTQASNTMTVTVTYQPPPAGATPWVSIGTVPVGAYTTRDALILSPTDWMITTRRNGIHHTTDGGVTFTAINVGLGVGQSAGDMQMLVQSNSGAILVSANCNTTCTQKAGIFKWDTASSSWQQAGLTQPVAGFAWSPLTGELLAVAYVASTNSWDVHRSIDDGKTFTDISHKFSPGTPVQFACGPDGQCWLATSNDGIYTSASSDYSTWTKVSTVNGATGFGFFGTQVIALTPTDLRMFDPATQTFVTIAASGWSAQDIGQSAYSSATSFYLGSNHVLVGVYSSKDLQLFSPFQEPSWNALANSGTGVRVYALKAIDATHVLAVLRDGRLYSAQLP